MFRTRALIDADTLEGLKRGLLAGAAVLVLAVPPALQHRLPATRTDAVAPATHTARPAATPVEPDFGSHVPSPDARALAAGILRTADHGARPFAIIDKRDARLYVFRADGRLDGTTPILLGYAAGDETVPGIGERPIDQVKPHERTTPAGRFVADRGRNAIGENVVWVDYAAAVSMHPVRLTDPRERRAQRLATPTPEDNRISYGCINIPPEFFAQVVWPHFGTPGNRVYVLPETKPAAAVFPRLVSPAA
jgi:hypothetical protein